MINYILVGLGGALGAILRYFVTAIFNYFFYYSFAGTLIVNIIGSFFIGFFIFILQNKIHSTNVINYFLIIGVFGSFTTFSAFSYETLELILNNKVLIASMYILTSVFVCIIAAYLGLNFHKIIN